MSPSELFKKIMLFHVAYSSCEYIYIYNVLIVDFISIGGLSSHTSFHFYCDIN